MADEIRLAFAHPAERAIATADEAPRDRISLRDHVVEVEIEGLGRLTNPVVQES